SSSAAPGSRPRRSGARRRAARLDGRATRGDRARCCVPCPSRRGARRPGRAARSVARVPLLSPRVAVVVVAVGLPEAGLVLLAQLEPAHPFGALPEVEVRDEEPRRPAVLGLERLAAELVRDPCLTSADVLEREVGRVAPVAEGGHVLGA